MDPSAQGQSEREQGQGETEHATKHARIRLLRESVTRVARSLAWWGMRETFTQKCVINLIVHSSERFYDKNDCKITYFPSVTPFWSCVMCVMCVTRRGITKFSLQRIMEDFDVSTHA